VTAGIVIGADGLRSTVARLVGAKPYLVARHATAVVFGYWSGIQVEGYHFHYRPGVSAGAIPTNDGQACVFTATPPERFSRETLPDLEGSYARVLREAAPDLAEHTRAATRVGKLRSFAGVPGMFRPAWGPGWALVGDAGYFKDPITAHGITDAFRDADLLAQAVIEGTDEALARYQATRDDLALGFFEATDHVASFEWDYGSLQRSHRRASEEMARETSTLLEWDRASVAEVADLDVAAVSAPPMP
jgi:flavin-dependent dehydrogenase